jgi:PAS domain S-box-containing protein
MLQDQAHSSESLLLESEQRYRDVIQNASDFIQSIRPDGTFEFVNKAWLDALGYTAQEVEGLNIWDVIYPDSVGECQVHFGAAMQGTPLNNIRVTFMDKQGNPIHAEGSTQTRFLEGKVFATHGFFRDIAERLRIEQLEREQQARYFEKMAALGKLSAGLSHELNNPAAAAQRSAKHFRESLDKRDAAAEKLINRGVSADAWRMLEELVNRCAGERDDAPELSPMAANRLEDELLDWLQDRGIEEAWNYSSAFVQKGITVEDLEKLAGQLAEGAMSPAISWLGESLALDEHTNVIERSMHRISELVGAVKSYSFRDQAIEQDVNIHDGLDNTLVILAYQLKSMKVETDYDTTIPAVRTYGSGLNQVWTNILDNAVDATKGEGTIKIRTYRDGANAVVEITDNGEGIKPEAMSRIFEPFYTTKPQGDGTGLGLDIAWRIVTDEHRGELSAESKPGETTFRVSIPICPDILASEESQGERTLHAPV